MYKEKSVTLDNILIPYDDDIWISDIEDNIVYARRNICFTDDTHLINKKNRNKKRTIYDNIKTKHYIKIGETCSICLEEIWSKKDAFLTDCGHGFHASCINRYYYKNEHATCFEMKFNLLAAN